MSGRILIVEDEPIIAEDLSMIVTKAGYQVVGIANDGMSAMDLLHSQDVDLALLDIALDGSINGIDIARVINDKYRIPFIFITSFGDEQTLDMVKEVFPSGYIVKPFKKKDILANLSISIHRSRQVKKGIYLDRDELNEGLEKPISEREYELILDLSKGLSNQAMCDKHFISINTIKTHMKRIFSKLDVSNRSQVVAMIMRKDQ